MYNTKEINISNITLNLAIFVYFYFINLIVIYEGRNFFSEDETSILYVFMMLGACEKKSL